MTRMTRITRITRMARMKDERMTRTEGNPGGSRKMEGGAAVIQ